ncbi:non-canonical purine NTP diphosphatase [Dokdonia sinensis]|uniref:dITP/XTP pyrophosphatase n=1 Tax=Dokdonia sinensis TaxID=2479847 RepID=A0A3M0GUE3_9FLAO|nr:non-canonical purine NTP diphosphatase [Dokdonia sinensis]RMB60936.1 non-canonical purine NTP diphosphatase [Dokdonia sinensis]
MKIVFATHNPNKLREIQALVPSHITLVSLTDIGCTEDIIEDAPTIEGNAILKAKYVKDKYGFDCFADDTGLEVNALNGAPGVYSARYAGEQKNALDNMNKLLIELATKHDRSARFKTVIAFAKTCPELDSGADKIQTFEGICKGQITREKLGDGGFGYDPIFQPDGFDATFAQMAMQLKGKISHRGRAFEKFVDFLGQ